jgi:hypothetical protein
MIMKKLIYLLVILFSVSVTFAQQKLSKEEKDRREKNIQAGNPFVQFGYKAKIATLSKGKYLEFHDQDSVVTIGTVRLHVNKKQIVGTFIQDSLNPDAQPIGDRAARWIAIDPLSEEFSDWSPYNMCFNNPIKYIDPDGKGPLDWFKNQAGRVVWFDSTSKQFTGKSGDTWTNVGSNLNEVKQNLDVPTQVQTIKWGNTKAALVEGEDGNKKSLFSVNVIHFQSTAQVDYSLNVKNDGAFGQLISGKTEIDGVNVNARVTTETFAPGIQIDGVSGAFGIKEFTPSSLIGMGHNFTGKSNPFQDFSGQMLSNSPFHATSEATLQLSLSNYSMLNNSFGTSSGLNLKFNTSTSTTNLGTGDELQFNTGN